MRHTHKRNSISCCERSTNASQNCNTKRFWSSDNDYTHSNSHTEPCLMCGDTYHPVGIIYSIHVNFCNKSNSRGCIWVPGSTLHFQAVYPVLIVGLKQKKWRAINIKNTGQNASERPCNMQSLCCLLLLVQWSCLSTVSESCLRHPQGPSWLCHHPHPSAPLRALPTNENCVEL